MPERVQVYSGVLILSMSCTHPGTSRGLTKDNYLARLFLARRLWAFVGNLRFGLLFPRFLFLVFDFLTWCVRRPRSEVPPLRRARNAVEDSGDLRPCRKAHTGGLRPGRAGAAC